MESSNRYNFNNKKPLLFLLIPIFIFGVGFLVMFLWNAVLPDLLGLKAITYWQSMGLFLLTRILFGGFGKGGGNKGFGRHRFKEKMMNMTDEEKEKFREEWKKRC